MWPILVMAALAAAKNQMVDKPAADRQRHLAAETQKYSPWTHLTAEAPQDPNLAGDIISGGATGASMMNANANQQATNNLTAAQTKYLQSKTDANDMASLEGEMNKPNRGRIMGAGGWGGVGTQSGMNPNWTQS